MLHPEDRRSVESTDRGAPLVRASALQIPQRGKTRSTRTIAHPDLPLERVAVGRITDRSANNDLFHFGPATRKLSGCGTKTENEESLGSAQSTKVSPLRGDERYA